MTNPQPLPARYLFALYRGDTRVWEHHFAEDDGTPVDISGWVFEGEYRLTADAATVLASETCVVTDGPGGVMTRTLPASEAAKLTPLAGGTVAWDLQATKPDGTVRTWLTNPLVKVTEDVSR